MLILLCLFHFYRIYKQNTFLKFKIDTFMKMKKNKQRKCFVSLNIFILSIFMFMKDLLSLLFKIGKQYLLHNLLKPLFYPEPLFHMISNIIYTRTNNLHVTLNHIKSSLFRSSSTSFNVHFQY